MNLTLSIDERTLKKARRAAASMGMSLNQAVRRFLEELAGDDSVDKDISEMNDLSARSGGRSHGWRFDREEIHERRP
jgi:antitoxin component of RelBE/YafQ-DinJ toxin-antitoxin module